MGISPLGIRRRAVTPALLLAILLASCAQARAADGEFMGTFEPQLAPNRDELERVVFKPARDLSKLKLAEPVGEGAAVAAGWLYDARSDKSAIQSLLVEPEAEAPFLLADVDLDGQISAAERFDLERAEDGGAYLWETTLEVPTPGGPFAKFPLLVRLLRNVRWEGMKEGERMVLESRGAFARGHVDLAGRKTLVQYAYSPRGKKVSPMRGALGVDADGDGAIDMDRFSPEAVDAQDEVAVFRVGDLYVSTKRADVEKNQIVMRGHKASDYKRVEVRVGGEMPDFEFTDFDGKKRRLSEYRGKYVLVDFWGMWCPPCRDELPYLREAYKRFQPRGFEIVGMNTDDAEIVPQVKAALRKNGMDWVQAKRESITNVLRSLRIASYPTTVLVGPDGKILSLNNTAKGQPSLRGSELLESLDALIAP